MLALLLAGALALPLGLLASVLMLASMFSLAVTLGQALKGLRRKHYRPAPLLALGATGGTGWLMRSPRRGALRVAGRERRRHHQEVWPS